MPAALSAALTPDTRMSQAVARPHMTWRYTVLTLRDGETGSLANRAGHLFRVATEWSDDAFTGARNDGGTLPGAGACGRPAGRATVRRTRPAGSFAAPDALFAGRQAHQLPARPRRCAGGLRPVGLGRVAQDASPAGRFAGTRPRRGKALRRGRSPARAPAHRGPARYRRLPLVAR